MGVFFFYLFGVLAVGFCRVSFGSMCRSLNVAQPVLEVLRGADSSKPGKQPPCHQLCCSEVGGEFRVRFGPLLDQVGSFLHAAQNTNFLKERAGEVHVSCVSYTLS